MRHNVQRQHKFADDAVYVDTIPKTRDGTQAQIHNARAENEDNNYDYHYFNNKCYYVCGLV